MKLLTMAEFGLIARDHMLRLTPYERRRFLALMRTARGRPNKLGRSEREELADLVGKLEPRLLAGEAVDRLSPVPIPRRIVRGPKR